MWAFALWDRDTQTLLLARDRLGKKPIVIARTPEYLAFASEAAALFRLPFVGRRLDRGALPHWLRFAWAPAPLTLVEGMSKLPPASRLEARAGAPVPEPVRWWAPGEPDPNARADAAWFERLDDELLEATRLRTVSDVPIGVFLSGGVDSNVVLSTLKRTGHRPIRTFTLGFEGLEDERARASLGATRFADDHVELIARADAAREIAEILPHFGDPIGDSAVVTSALIAREASQHVKVILNGDGGDELFGGYARYPLAARVARLRALPGGLALLRARYGSRANAGDALAHLAAGEVEEAGRALGALASHAEVDALLAPGPAAHALAPGAFPGANGAGLTAALFAWDSGSYLPDDLLVKVDVAAMAFALENRSPLLDHRLFEHVGRLRARARTRVGETKPLLRRYARGRVPDEVLDAPKQGFQLPLEHWLRGPLKPWLDGLLAPPQATIRLWRAGAVESLLARFHSGAAGELAAYRLWALAALEFWARHFAIEIGG
jgi:asparagine synthase (glutamine-hydrolysing)